MRMLRFRNRASGRPRSAWRARVSPGGQRISAEGGFTLIELLVVVAIVGLAVGVIGACLAAGVRVWETARTCNDAEGQALIALEIMEKDLRNSFVSPGIDFTGSQTEVAFPGLIAEETAAVSPGAPEEGARLGTVKYVFLRETKTFLRREWPFPTNESDAKGSEQLLSGVGGVRLQYFSLPSTKDKTGGGPGRGGQWQGEWSSPTSFPVAVKIDLVFDGGAWPTEITRTVFLPLCE